MHTNIAILLTRRIYILCTFHTHILFFTYITVWNIHNHIVATRKIALVSSYYRCFWSFFSSEQARPVPTLTHPFTRGSRPGSEVSSAMQGRHGLSRQEEVLSLAVSLRPSVPWPDFPRFVVIINSSIRISLDEGFPECIVCDIAFYCMAWCVSRRTWHRCVWWWFSCWRYSNLGYVGGWIIRTWRGVCWTKVG